MKSSRQEPIHKVAIMLVVLFAVGAVWIGARAQAISKVGSSGSSSDSSATSPTATVKKVPPRPAPACCGYPFPRETDAEIAASDVHIVHYEDSHVMFLEVANPPMYHVHMHGHPYASVFTHDSTIGPKDPDAVPPSPEWVNGQLDPSSGYNNMAGSNAAAPAGMKWPSCNSSAPQAPHRGPYDTNLAPNHFYRIEILHQEGTDFQAHWKEWYPEMLEPEKPVKELNPAQGLGPNFSEQWPYNIAYDSIVVAPNNFKLLFEDGKMRFIEVTIRPGETTPMHGDPYPTVFVYNSISGDPSLVTETYLDPASPLNGQGGGHSGPPKLYNLTAPTCGTVAPQGPHKIHNGLTVPVHYYRVEYKRIDGDGLAANWRKWYPWMQYMQFIQGYDVRTN